MITSKIQDQATLSNRDSARVLQLLQESGRVSMLHPELHGIHISQLVSAAKHLRRDGHAVYWDGPFLMLSAESTANASWRAR